MALRILKKSLVLGVAISTLSAEAATLNKRANPNLDACPGYVAHNIKQTASTLTALLKIGGEACNIYGPDISELYLEVSYDYDTQIHVKISDANNQRYEVPESIFPRRTPAQASSSAHSADIKFVYTASPFSFQIIRSSTGEKLFDTTGNTLIFENQYLRLKTNLPGDANIYGLGEHTERLRLDPTNTTRTLWSRDAYGIPQNSNLYGVHPIYFEHRKTGTHGVFLLNSNGMDVKINGDGKKTTLEYNVIGGILDLFFFAGPKPVDVARQYAKVAGTPAMTPYWNLGLHQCRWGYRDWIDVAEVIANYSIAGIPLETMWTDIDYMDKRYIFTLDPANYPIQKVREIINYLHAHDQHYVLMVDPAIAYQDYPTFNRGVEDDVFLKLNNGSIYQGVVWPGIIAYPDWFHPNTTSFWTKEFALFFNPETGVDIDGAWIDMNEPTNFCDYPCVDPAQTARDRDVPPVAPPARNPPRPIPGFPDTYSAKRMRRSTLDADYINPPYAIANDWPNGISDRTAATDLVHANGLLEYNTHNLFGTMMSATTREAMLSRRPGLRPAIITRSTFAGAGTKVGKWLGDNLSTWDHYRISIAGMLGFASFYQVPVVGSDVCGFGDNTTETLCARWASLGAFSPFYRNHNTEGSISQEFYRWNLSASSAKYAINIRYRLLDYIYTALAHQNVDGTPAVSPMYFSFPEDENTFGIDLQFFYGPNLLVSPVTQENLTSVEIYLPEGIWYEWEGLAKVVSGGRNFTLSDVPFDRIPLHVKGGSILPLRVESGMTTTETRSKGFELLVAPDANGAAYGTLYLDDGVSLEQKAVSNIKFVYSHTNLVAKGEFGFDAGVGLNKVSFLDVEKPSAVIVNGRRVGDDKLSYNQVKKILTVEVDLGLRKAFSISF
ncbi:hypothetical protein RUND412_004462 [Rhizina undulata]